MPSLIITWPAVTPCSSVPIRLCSRCARRWKWDTAISVTCARTGTSSPFAAIPATSNCSASLKLFEMPIADLHSRDAMALQSEISSSSPPLFADPSANHAREAFRSKNRCLTDKLTSVADAVQRCVHDGDYLAIGG